MNLDHTVGDIRNFINAYVLHLSHFLLLMPVKYSPSARPGNATVPYVIQTPLPIKILSDESQTIEAAGLKNAVVVQRNL
jgi:UBX domain-containing protein 1